MATTMLLLLGMLVMALGFRVYSVAAALHHPGARATQRVGRSIRKDIEMIWANWSDFFAIGGDGLFVWGSYGVTLALMVAELVLLVRRERGLLA